MGKPAQMKKILVCLFLLLSSYCYPGSYNRIVSLGPAITEDLYLLGAGDKIIAVTTYCIRPKEAISKQKVGTVTEIDIEKIVSLRPDMVIATPLTNMKQVEKLKQLGVPIISLPPAEKFSDICSQFLELGRLTGKRDEVEEIIKNSNEKIKQIKDKVKNLRKIKVFVQIGANPLFTISKNSFINDYIELAGGENIASDSGAGFYSREVVLEKNPDAILIVGMGVSAEAEEKMWKRYKNLKAVQNNRIFIMDSYKICSPTPVSFAEVLEEMARTLRAGYDE